MLVGHEDQEDPFLLLYLLVQTFLDLPKHKKRSRIFISYVYKNSCLVKISIIHQSQPSLLQKSLFSSETKFLNDLKHL